MKKIIIDGKVYWQQEECDIPKISMEFDKDILTKYKFDDIEESKIYSEIGVSSPISFITSDGIKTIQPDKKYDMNLNEIVDQNYLGLPNLPKGE